MRRAIIAAHPALRERELIELPALGDALAGALRARGAAAPAAILAAESGIAIFKLAFERWLDDPRERDFARHVRECRDELAAVVRPPPARRLAPVARAERRCFARRARSRSVDTRRLFVVQVGWGERMGRS